MVLNQVFIQMYFTPEEIFLNVLYNFYQVIIRDAPGISEKDENRSKSTKVTKVSIPANSPSFGRSLHIFHLNEISGRGD